MLSIDVFTKIDLPKEKVFDFLLNSHTVSRCTSPFFKFESFRCNNSHLNKDSFFSQKFVLWDGLQLFFHPTEIVNNQKIVYEFEGLIKGTQTFSLLSDGESCVIREKIEFSLYNQMNIALFDFICSILFYVDALLRHVRLKTFIYKDNNVFGKGLLTDWSTIRSYIVIDGNLDDICSLFEDLNKLSLWISPFLKIELKEQISNGVSVSEFDLSFVIPVLPKFSCKLVKKDSNKIEIFFSNSLMTGVNTWSIFKNENEFVIENSIEIEEILSYLKFAWVIFGNTLVKGELSNLTKRLKEIVERANLSRYIESPQTA